MRVLATPIARPPDCGFGMPGLQHASATTNSKVALATDALHAFGHLRLRVTGASMLPAVLPGDVLQFESCDATQVETGDVVLFRRNDQLVIHRMLSRTSSTLLTQGDALARPDPPVAHTDVLAKVVGISRQGRPMARRHPATLGERATRWLLRRSNLATRLFLHWQRLSTRTAA